MSEPNSSKVDVEGKNRKYKSVTKMTNTRFLNLYHIDAIATGGGSNS